MLQKPGLLQPAAGRRPAHCCLYPLQVQPQLDPAGIPVLFVTCGNLKFVKKWQEGTHWWARRLQPQHAHDSSPAVHLGCPFRQLSVLFILMHPQACRAHLHRSEGPLVQTARCIQQRPTHLRRPTHVVGTRTHTHTHTQTRTHTQMRAWYVEDITSQSRVRSCAGATCVGFTNVCVCCNNRFLGMWRRIRSSGLGKAFIASCKHWKLAVPEEKWQSYQQARLEMCVCLCVFACPLLHTHTDCTMHKTLRTGRACVSA